MILLGACSLSSFAEVPKVEIFSWWLGGGEEEGLQALIKVLKRQYPALEVNNASIAGGAGVNAKAVLQTRMVEGLPPDSFQVHGGAELIDSYVKTGMMEPITDLLKIWQIREKFNPQIIELCSYRGQVYSIPLNVHRGNVLWYNKKLLARYKLAPPTNYETLLRACQVLKKAGIIPLALGDRNKWEATHLFETLLVQELGAIKYNGLWKKQTSFNDPKLRIVLERFKKLSQYVNKNHAALTWQDGTKMILEGKAVFNIMGDWAEGYLKTLGGEPGKDFGWVALLGKGGNYMIITDTFGLPKGALHRQGALAWLKTVASVEGQDIFNPIKGSIPSRLDANRALYDPYLRSSMDDFAKLTLTPSIAHGSAAPFGFVGALNDLLNTYLVDGQTEVALKSIRQAAHDYLE